MRHVLATSTALVASLSLLAPMPNPVSAQNLADALESAAAECPEDLSAEECEAFLEEREGEAAEEAAPAATQTQPAAEELPQDTTPEPEPEAEAAAPPAEEVAPEAEMAPVEDEMPVEMQGEAEVETEVETETEGLAAPLEAEEPAPDDGAVPQDEAEAAAPADAGDLAEQLGAGQAEAVETEVETEAEAETTVETEETTVEPETETVETTEPVEAEPAEGGLAAGLEEQDAAESAETAPSATAMEAAEGTAAEVMASETGDAADAVVEEVTETVTEEDVRASDEDTAAAAAAADAADAVAVDDDDDGLSDIGRALIGAAGAVVIGSILSGDREVVSRGQDRIVVRDPQGNLQVLRNDDEILRRPGSEVTTRTYADGSTRTVIDQPDGSRVVTIRGPELRVLKRSVIAPDGTETVLFDDTRPADAVEIDALPRPDRQAAVQVDPTNRDALRAALLDQATIDRGFSLRQIRQIDRVRYLAPAVDIERITFETGSAAIQPSQAEELFALGQLMTDLIEENPGEVFLIEGHTDAVGDAAYNLALSDRRAESVALALTEYFGVSPANMVLQGYGESDLRVPTSGPERANRRVVVRRITPLLQTAQAR